MGGLQGLPHHPSLLRGRVLAPHEGACHRHRRPGHQLPERPLRDQRWHQDQQQGPTATQRKGDRQLPQRRVSAATPPKTHVQATKEGGRATRHSLTPFFLVFFLSHHCNELCMLFH